MVTARATETYPDVDAPHPLLATLAHLPVAYDGSGEPSVRLGPPSSTGAWFSAHGLLGRQSGLIDDAMAEIGAADNAEKRDVQAAYYFGAYAWFILGAALTPYLIAKRVPDISPANVWGTTTSGRLSRIALRHGRFACLPDDPAASHPDATVVADADALLTHCRTEVEARLGAMIGMMRVRRIPWGPRAMWAMVSDYAIEIAIDTLGPAATDEALTQIISPLVQNDASPMEARSWFYQVDGNRQSAFFCDRNGCCLTYKISGTEKCGSCPLRPKTERIELMRDYLNSLR